MQSVHIRMNLSLSPPLKKILDPPMDVCVFGPGINGLQRLMNICDDDAAEDEIDFYCNKGIGVYLSQKV